MNAKIQIIIIIALNAMQQIMAMKNLMEINLENASCKH